VAVDNNIVVVVVVVVMIIIKGKKVKLSRYTPRRHTGGEEV
jgi:hypothetical protein